MIKINKIIKKCTEKEKFKPLTEKKPLSKFVNLFKDLNLKPIKKAIRYKKKDKKRLKITTIKKKNKNFNY